MGSLRWDQGGRWLHLGGCGYKFTGWRTLLNSQTFFFFLLCQEHSRQSPRPCPDLVGLVPLYVKVKIRLKLPRLGANLCSGFLLLFFSCFQDQVFSPGLPGAH